MGLMPLDNMVELAIEDAFDLIYPDIDDEETEAELKAELRALLFRGLFAMAEYLKSKGLTVLAESVNDLYEVIKDMYEEKVEPLGPCRGIVMATLAELLIDMVKDGIFNWKTIRGAIETSGLFNWCVYYKETLKDTEADESG